MSVKSWLIKFEWYRTLTSIKSIWSGNMGYNINNINVIGTNMQQTVDCEWTKEDTAICVKAESSGLAFSLETNQFVSIEEMIKMGNTFEKVKQSTSVDAFLNSRVKAVPFESFRQKINAELSDHNFNLNSIHERVNKIDVEIEHAKKFGRFGNDE